MPVAKKVVIVTDNLKSQSIKRLATKLSENLGYKVWRVKPGRERNRRVVSFPRGIDKLTQFRKFTESNVSCPKFTTNAAELSTLDEFKNPTYVARKLLNSSEGKGIQIFGKDDHTPVAPMYTQYVPKKQEFRVHVYNNVVIDVSEKRKRKGFNEEDRDTHVRNLANGYVFCRDSIQEPASLRDLAVSAVRALGRTQGAVDVIYNGRLDKCFVLEVNSNPGMEGTTLDRYVEAIVNAK